MNPILFGILAVGGFFASFLVLYLVSWTLGYGWRTGVLTAERVLVKKHKSEIMANASVIENEAKKREQDKK